MSKWSGWATQYPGKLPKLYGAREIAEVNFDPGNGQRLVYLVEARPPSEYKGVEGGKAGGLARATKLTAEQRSEIARKGAKARWAKNGA